jgi:hypothetical protein
MKSCPKCNEDKIMQEEQKQFESKLTTMYPGYSLKKYADGEYYLYEAGEYKDREVAFMWIGWQLANGTIEIV